MAGKPAIRHVAGQVAAARAVMALGGPTRAAQALTAADPHGRQLTAATVSRWANTGVPPAWCPLVHQLTGVPLSQLDPVVYPPAVIGEGEAMLCKTCKHWGSTVAVGMPDGRVVAPCLHPAGQHWSINSTGGMNCSRWESKEAGNGSRA